MPCTSLPVILLQDITRFWQDIIVKICTIQCPDGINHVASMWPKLSRSHLCSAKVRKPMWRPLVVVVVLVVGSRSGTWARAHIIPTNQPGRCYTYLTHVPAYQYILDILIYIPLHTWYMYLHTFTYLTYIPAYLCILDICTCIPLHTLHGYYLHTFACTSYFYLRSNMVNIWQFHF